ncbi:hypothetical protein [Paraburkholderia sp. 22B1P]|uniref:ATP-dependent DNA ligase n=1 Tax=Paraburkholderia sp. 22B1P TaxID=3080498 RepID=UPI0030CBE82F
MLCRIDNGAVTLFTRNGHDWTDRMPALAEAFEGLPVSQAWIDGEVVALNKADIPDFSALQNAFARRRTAGLTFFAFDLMFLDGRDLRQLRLSDRQAALRHFLCGVDDAHIRLSNTFTDGVESLLDSACRMGLEGLIGKRVDRPIRKAARPTGSRSSASNARSSSSAVSAETRARRQALDRCCSAYMSAAAASGTPARSRLRCDPRRCASYTGAWNQ